MEDQKLYFSENFEVITTNNTELMNSLENQMVAMGKALVRAKKNLSETEYKLLIMSLTKINWSKTEHVNEVELDKKEIAEVLGIAQDKNLSIKLRKMFFNLSAHSQICFDKSDGEWEDGVLIINRRSTKGSIIVRFNDYYMPLLSNLLKDKDFVTIWANDIYKFESTYAYMLFEELRLHCDTSRTNWRTYTTKQLKELFGIPQTGKGSYMHYDAQKGKDVFDRSNFEKKVLDTAINEINKGQMVNILPIIGSAEIKKGKCYEKIKKNGFVEGYRFKYVVKTNTKPPCGYDEDEIEGQDTVFNHPEWLPEKN